MNHAEKLATAVDTLREFLAEPVVSKRDVAGVLQGFGFTFELAWKALQDEIVRRGYLERGPRPVLQAGLLSGIIPPEHAESWARIVEDRNLMAHTYRQEWAFDLVKRIEKEHFAVLSALSAKLNSKPSS